MNDTLTTLIVLTASGTLVSAGVASLRWINKLLGRYDAKHGLAV
jgi:hypothetical protein